MQDKRSTKIIIQWVIPTVLLMALLVNTLIKSWEENKGVVDSFVRNRIEQTGATYCRNINLMLQSMMSEVNSMDVMLEQNGASAAPFLEDAIAAVTDCGTTNRIVYCNIDGSVVMQGEEPINLSTTDYFSKLQGTSPFFTYTENDGITGKEAILYVNPVTPEEEADGYLIAYLSPEMLKEVFENSRGYWSDVFFAVVDDDGKIMASYGGVIGTSLLKDDFWNYVKQGTQTDGDWDSFDKSRMNRLRSRINIVKEKEQRILYQFPIGNTQFCMVMGIDQSYADEMLSQIWNPIVELLITIGICVICYLTLIVVINVKNGIKNLEQKRELEDKMESDLLTGLNNKIATEEKISEYMRLYPQSQAVLFVLDVDNFKKINDTLGHAFGDEVLRSLGVRLQSLFRVTDIIGRIGGDEFIIFLKDIKSDTDITREGKKIETFFQQFEVGEYVKYSVTASVGGAVFPRDADNFMDLYKAADVAVYTSKKRGKNRVSFYHESEHGSEK